MLFFLLDYLGCYQDTLNKDLNGSFYESKLMTVKACKLFCANKNYTYAGLQNKYITKLYKLLNFY